MQSLIQKARTQDKGIVRGEFITDEEAELYTAYMQGEVTARQCAMALGRSYAYFYNWTRRCSKMFYATGRLSITTATPKTVFRPTIQLKRQLARV